MGWVEPRHTAEGVPGFFYRLALLTEARTKAPHEIHLGTRSVLEYLLSPVQKVA